MLQRRVELPLFFRQDKDRSASAKPVKLGQQQPPLAAREQSCLTKSSLIKQCELPVIQASQSVQPSAQNWVHAHAEETEPAGSAGHSEQSQPADSSQPNPASIPPTSHWDATPPFEDRTPADLDLSSFLQNQRLRQVERKLRSSLNLATVLGATVVETAAFFQARQVSLLCYSSTLQRWQPVAQYCENQTLAWQQLFSFSLDEFPTLIETLQQGRSVFINSGRDRVIAQEAHRWRSQWVGNWLLVPVKRRQTVGYSLNGAVSKAAIEGASREHWGIMALAYAHQQIWSAQQAALAQSIVVELEWAIAQARQHQELMLANQELQKASALRRPHPLGQSPPI